MSLQFGTSGLRGLVTDLTDDAVARYAAGFVRHLGGSDRVLIGRDLRESSPRIANAVAAGLCAAGAKPVDCGAVPTPALAFAAQQMKVPAIMVTGSHIPADRNGLKFYTARGEIGKDDEAGILEAAANANTSWAESATDRDDTVKDRFRARYADAFRGHPIKGLRIGVYQHASVARDLLCLILQDLGASVTPLGRAAEFVPVDTEAVSQEAIAQLRSWSTDHDAIVSTDGDADRPMVADENGMIVPGDVLGPITAREIGAKVVVTPVSSNTLVSEMGAFSEIIQTKIGSPYVVAGMDKLAGQEVVGYEANGGFLLGFQAGTIAPLLTRDSVLPIIVPLIAAKRRGLTLSQLRAELPPVFTASDRLQDIPTERSAALIAELTNGSDIRQVLFNELGAALDQDSTDGLRLRFADDLIVHLRPSGNAPELRCYAQATTQAAASQAVARTLDRISDHLHMRSKS